jgi:hypothetical protein
MQEIIKARKIKKDTSFPAQEIPTQARRRTRPNDNKKTLQGRQEEGHGVRVCVAWDNRKQQVFVHNH